MLKDTLERTRPTAGVAGRSALPAEPSPNTWARGLNAGTDGVVAKPFSVNGRPVSRPAIIEQVWRMQSNAITDVVDVYISHRAGQN